LKEKKLSLSHSIPRAYIKRTKTNGKTITINNGGVSSISNFDPKELMLCDECESLISKNYENYGVSVLRTRSNVIKHKEYILFKNINYEKFYLFLLSILWRASISELVFYNTVTNVERLSESMRLVLLNNKMKMQDSGSFKIDQLIKICIFRIIDSTGFIPDEVIKGLMSNFGQDVQRDIDGILWYFAIDGFLIVYSLPIGKDPHEYRYLKLHSQLCKNNIQKFYKLDMHKSSILMGFYENLIKSFIK